MSIIVSGEGSLSFKWMGAVSGTFEYRIDDEESIPCDGVGMSWSDMTIELTGDRRHEVTLTYCMPENDDYSDDGVWIDDVRWYAPRGWDDPDEIKIPISVSVSTIINLRLSPYVEKLEGPMTNYVQRIAFSPDWSSAARVQVSVNGTVLTNTTESGSFIWTPPAKGQYEFRLSKLDANGNKVEEDDVFSYFLQAMKGVMMMFY